MSLSRLAIILLLASLTPALPCIAQQAAAPAPGTTLGSQFGPDSSPIPMTPGAINPRQQETPEAIPETTPGQPSAAPFIPLEPEPENGATSSSSQSDFRSAIEQDPRPNTLDR